MNSLFDRRFDFFRQVDTGEKDRYGKPIITRSLTGSWRSSLQPVRSAEGEAFVVDTFNFYVEPAADLQAGDEFEGAGQIYRVEGAPFLNTMIPAVLNHWSGVARRTGPVAS